jgi:hypothetical protein
MVQKRLGRLEICASLPRTSEGQIRQGEVRTQQG